MQLYCIIKSLENLLGNNTITHIDFSVRRTIEKEDVRVVYAGTRRVTSAGMIEIIPSSSCSKMTIPPSWRFTF